MNEAREYWRQRVNEFALPLQMPTSDIVTEQNNSMQHDEEAFKASVFKNMQELSPGMLDLISMAASSLDSEDSVKAAYLAYAVGLETGARRTRKEDKPLFGDIIDVVASDVDAFPEAAQAVLETQEDDKPARLIKAWIDNGNLEKDDVHAAYILALYHAGVDAVEDLRKRMLE